MLNTAKKFSICLLYHISVLLFIEFFFFFLKFFSLWELGILVLSPEDLLSLLFDLLDAPSDSQHWATCSRDFHAMHFS